MNNKDWSLTDAQVRRFKRVLGDYKDIFEFISEIAQGGSCECEDCPINCNPDNGDCEHFVYEYIKNGTTKRN